MPFKDDSTRKKAFSNSFDSFTDRTKDTFTTQQNKGKSRFVDYDSFVNPHNHKSNDVPYIGGQGYTSYLDDGNRFTGNSSIEFREQTFDIRDDHNYEIGSYDSRNHDSGNYVDRNAASNYVNEHKNAYKGYDNLNNDVYSFTSISSETEFHEQHVEIQNNLGYEIKNNQGNFDRSAVYKHIKDEIRESTGVNPKGYSYNPYRNDQNHSDYKNHDEIANEVLSEFTSVDKFKDPESEMFRNRSFDTYTDKGGGAVFHHDINEKGLIQTQIQLKRKNDRTDRQGFRQKSFDFIDKTERAFETVKPEDNVSAASNVEDKLLIAGNILKDHFNDDRDRYHDIYKDRKKILRQIDRIERSSKGKELFNKSETRFKEQKDAFYDKFENAFRTPGTDRLGNSYFVPNEQQRIMTASALSGLDRNSADGFKVQAYSTRNAYSSYIDSKFSEGNTGTTEYVSGNLAIDDKFSSSQENLSKKGLSGPTEKFEDIKSDKTGNNSTRSVASYFDNDSDSREIGKQGFRNSRNKDIDSSKKDNGKNEASNGNEKDTLKSEKSEAKKQEKKAKKRMAAVASVQNMLRAKKNFQNEIGNYEQVPSDDLIAASNPFILHALLESAKQAVIDFARKIILNIVSAVMPMFLIILSIGLLFVVILMALEIFSHSATEMIEVAEGDGYTFDYLEDYQIDEIIADLYLNYEMTEEKESLIRYALSKVGCAYDQNYHTSLTADIFDCSSLAYRSYREIGIDISNKGLYSAAEEARFADNNGYNAYDELQPGDLIFYGGSNNGRYKGIYHVGIYAGNGKMVEARGKKYGVVYTDVRTNNVVTYGRYL